MIRRIFALALFTGFLSLSMPLMSQTTEKALTPAEKKLRSDKEQDTKAAEWIKSLNLNDAAKESRAAQVISTHLKAIRDWNNDHPFTNVPAGINPFTGSKLTDQDRQIIAQSAMPKSIHDDLMAGLRKDLTEEQVEVILDKYTIGKVAFTLEGGYDIEGEKRSVRAVLREFVRASSPDKKRLAGKEKMKNQQTERLILQLKEIQGRYWKSL